MDKDLEEKLKNHPLPVGMQILPNVDVDPNGVVRMFSWLANICTPKQAKVVRKIQKEYADEHGITIYQ